jgi:carbon-monoxide dehydrogenase medium subunit
VVIAGLAGEREVSAEELFKGLFETDLQRGELIVAVRFPVPRPAVAMAFGELSRRRGDFALTGLAAVATVERDRIAAARLVYLGCVERAKVAATVSAAIAGARLPLADAAMLTEAVGRDLSPADMPGLRAETRLKMTTVLTQRVVNALSPAGRVE